MESETATDSAITRGSLPIEQFSADETLAAITESDIIDPINLGSSELVGLGVAGGMASIERRSKSVQSTQPVRNQESSKVTRRFEDKRTDSFSVAVTS